MLTVLLLAACGDGKGPADGPMDSEGIESDDEIALRLTDASGQEVNVISSGTGGWIAAKVDGFGDQCRSFSHFYG